MAGVSVKDKVSEVAGVKLVGTSSIELDRRVVWNIYLQRSASTESVKVVSSSSE